MASRGYGCGCGYGYGCGLLRLRRKWWVSSKKMREINKKRERKKYSERIKIIIFK